MKTIALLLLAVIYTAPATFAQMPPTPGVALADRYGLSGWDQIDEIGFTFNAELPNGERVKRVWSWNVRANMVIEHLEDEGEAQTAILIELVEPMPKDWQETHGTFINDSYWLLFPLQLVCSNPEVTDTGPAALPLGDGEAKKLICQWPAEGGYTPGDAYDLYLGDDGLIKQWDFRKGGGDQSFLATWEDHRQLGPITVSLDHHNADGTFRLWFTDVSATLADGTTVTPQPLAEPAAAPSVKPE